MSVWPLVPGARLRELPGFFVLPGLPEFFCSPECRQSENLWHHQGKNFQAQQQSTWTAPLNPFRARSPGFFWTTQIWVLWLSETNVTKKDIYSVVYWQNVVYKRKHATHFR